MATMVILHCLLSTVSCIYFLHDEETRECNQIKKIKTIKKAAPVAAFFVKYSYMKEIIFELTGEYIELIQLLKATRIAQSGAQAKVFVVEGLVTLNGTLESRKRAKVRVGDKVVVEDVTIIVKENKEVPQ